MFSSPDFWVLISFIGFFALLIYLKAPSKVAAALDERSDRISKELDDARQLREEAAALLAEYQRKRRDAESEAEEIVKAAKEEAVRLTNENQKALKESLERRTRLAELKIEQAEAQAIQDVRIATSQAAIAAAEKLIGDKLDAKAHAGLIKDSIDTVKEKLN